MKHTAERVDARLISSAPDLLEACKDTEIIYAEYWALRPAPGPQLDRVSNAMKRIRAAIARAEGRE